MGAVCSNANNQMPCCSTAEDSRVTYQGGTGSLRAQMEASCIDAKRGASNERQYQEWFDKQRTESTRLGTEPYQDRESPPRKKNILHDSSDDDDQPDGRIGDESTQDGRSLSKFE